MCPAVAKFDIIRKGGSLTLTSGTAGIKPGKGAAGGSALNGGLLSLTKALAGDLAEKKIRVNTVVPGLVKTELWDKQGKTAEEQKELFDKASQTLPVGFVATPEHIAEAYLYTIRADYATGTLVEIGKCTASVDLFVVLRDPANVWLQMVVPCCSIEYEEDDTPYTICACGGEGRSFNRHV